MCAAIKLIHDLLTCKDRFLLHIYTIVFGRLHFSICYLLRVLPCEWCCKEAFFITFSYSIASCIFINGRKKYILFFFQIHNKKKIIDYRCSTVPIPYILYTYSLAVTYRLHFTIIIIIITISTSLKDRYIIFNLKIIITVEFYTIMCSNKSFD